MEILKDLRDYPYFYTLKVKKFLHVIKSKQDTFYNKHVDGLREVYFFYSDALPYEGVFSNANIYYEYSRMKYENPNMKTYLNLNVMFHDGEILDQEGVFLNPQCLNLTKILLDFNENETTFLSMLQETFNKMGEELDKIYHRFGLNKETTLFIYFEKEGEINYPSFMELNDLPQTITASEDEEEETEEPEEDIRTPHYQRQLLPREVLNRDIDRYGESDAGQFWLNNEDHFRSGKYHVTYTNLGIEKIVRCESDQSEDEEEEVKNENKNKTFKSDQCVICCDKSPTYLFCSCGHLCICKDCFLIYDNNKCPICKIVNPNIREI